MGQGLQGEELKEKGSRERGKKGWRRQLQKKGGEEGNGFATSFTTYFSGGSDDTSK